MNVKLIKVIRKDNNGYKDELTRVTMYVDLIIDPKMEMTLDLENGTTFYINHIKQNLRHHNVILYEFEDICHRAFWDETFWDKYISKIYEEGWMKLAK
jgi:hypothetical protein